VIDDPCEVLLLFGVSGMVGTMNVAFLDPVNGIIYGNNTDGRYFGLQLMGLVCVGLWAAIMSAIFFVVLWGIGMLRVDIGSEVVGYEFMDFTDMEFGKKRLVRRVGDRGTRQVPESDEKGMRKS